MAVIASIDGANRLIYLSIDTVGASVHPVDIYKEMRTLRRTDESLRKYDPFLVAAGNVSKGGGKFTERYVICQQGTRIVPYDAVSSITVTGTIITDDGQEGIGCFDRSSLINRVDINYVPPQVEVIEVATGGGGGGGDVTNLNDIANAVAAKFAFNGDGRVQASIKGDESEKRLLREVKAAVPSFPNMAAVWDHAPKHLMQPMADLTPAIKALEEKLNALSTAAPSQMPALDLSPVIDALQDPARSLQPSLDALAEKVSNLAIPDHKDAIDDIRDRISDLSGALTDLELAAIGIRNRLDNLPQPDLSQVATKAEIKALESIASKLKNYDDSDIATMLQAMLADMRDSTGALSDRTGKLNQKLDLLLDNQLANF